MLQKQISLVRFDFETQPFDGDARQAHQLIPFIQAKLGSHQLSYILNTKDYPDPKLNEFILLLERQHMELLDATTAQYKTRKKHYDELQLPLYHHRLRTIAEDPDKDDDQKTQEIANIPVPVLPVLQAPPSEFNPGMESQLNKSRETIRRYDAAADQAIQTYALFFPLASKACVARSSTTRSATPAPNSSPCGPGSKQNGSMMLKSLAKSEKI